MENNITFLCFSPHCTHRLQLLDVSFIVCVSIYYEQEVRKFVIHPRAVTIYKVAKLFGAGFLQAANSDGGFQENWNISI